MISWRRPCINVQETLKEPGVTRFDLLRESAAPNRFLLVEVYRQASDHSRHKETGHYKRWAAEVEPLLAAPRSRTHLRKLLAA